MVAAGPTSTIVDRRFVVALVVVAIAGCGSAASPTTSTEAAPPVTFSPSAWTRIPHDAAVFGGEGDQRMESVTAGGPGLVAVGWEGGEDRDAAVWTSPNGAGWSRVADDQGTFSGGGFRGMASVAAGGPGLVAVGWEGSAGDTDAAVWTSPDGSSWSRVSDDTVLGGWGDQWMADVTAEGPGVVAVGWEGSGGGSDGAVWISQDGLNWSRASHDEAVFGGRGDQWMSGVTVGGPGLVVVGSDNSGDDRDAAVWATGSLPDGGE